MSEMSPLSRLLMKVLRAAVWGAAALLLLFAALMLYQRWTADGIALQGTDLGFLAVLGALFLLSLYLVRGIGRELQATREDDGS